MSIDAPSALELLDVWEAGQALPPVQRALALLTVARPDRSYQALAELPVGRRDAELLDLRERLFGPLVRALASCPGCGERFELTCTVSDIRVTPPDRTSVLVERDGYAVRVRPATSIDLLDLESMDGPAARERAVIARCTLEARRSVVDVAADELPDAVTEAIADAMAATDPQAEVQVSMECPACRHRWDALFDVVAFLWREIEAWARRMLDDVHTLASAYGWSEGEILSMSASRRRRYVAMVAQAS